MPVRKRTQMRGAVTLIELLVVIAVIAVLAGMLLPIFGAVTKMSHQTATLSNMRQIGAACLLYVGDNDYKLPNRALADPGQPQPDKWPKLFQPYVQDLRVYVPPVPDAKGKSYLVTDQTLLASNNQNYTSYIANGYNDLGALTDPTVYPRMNTLDAPAKTILFGIPYPQVGQFYMDFLEGPGNNNEVLNRDAFQGASIYVFSDGSARVLKYVSTDNMKVAPKSPDYYTDWLWLINKANASVIQ